MANGNWQDREGERQRVGEKKFPSPAHTFPQHICISRLACVCVSENEVIKSWALAPIPNLPTANLPSPSCCHLNANYMRICKKKNKERVEN